MKLFGLILLVIVGCVARKDWWERANFYQIYPRSFKDSDNDGVGDLAGVTEKLSYLKDIGMTGAWLSPIFESPMYDFGYDISNFYKIHNEFGGMDGLLNLFKRAKEIGLKVILDFVPNHTSDEHEWFQRSVKRDGIYTDFYVWHDGIRNESGRFPPNNWLNCFRYSAWQWHEKRGQYFLHQFGERQPDLNYRNPNVVQAMKEVLVFWLDKGVDGFRIDAVPYIYERADLPDEPEDPSCPDPDDYCHLFHIYTKDQPETYEMIYDWRDLVENYKRVNGGDTRVLLTEAYTSLENNIKFYGDGIRNGSNVPFNFEIINHLNSKSNAADFFKVIQSWLNKMPSDVQPNWVIGNHDQKRVTGRFGENKGDLMNILVQTLPGIAVTYYGEEIVMTDVWISWKDTLDPQACNSDEKNYHSYSRDPARTPFQWDASLNSGFSNASKTWLPVAPNYKQNNVAQQEKDEYSHLNIFKKLIELRHHQPSFIDGSLELHTAGSDDVLIYKRELPGNPAYVIVLNFGKQDHVVSLREVFPNITETVEVVTASLQSYYKPGHVVVSEHVNVEPEVGIVFISK